MKPFSRALTLMAALALPVSFAARRVAVAQTVEVHATRQMGTVKSISGSSLTLTVAGGAEVTASVAADAKILRLAPGSTDLKAAQTITLGDIAVGDRVLLTGTNADTGGFTASRVILMKSGDIAEKHQQEQADWQRRGAGGLVSAVDTAAGTVTITSRSRKVVLNTSPKTRFLRYSGGSVKFADARPGTLAQIQPGDQLRVLGDRSEDGANGTNGANGANGTSGTSIQAEEIVSGTFKNLSGLISKLDAGSGQVTLKDLATKKIVTVQVTADSAIHNLPEKEANLLAARAHGDGSGGGGGAASGGGGGQHASGAQRASGPGTRPGAGGGPGRGGAGGGAGESLAQMLPNLPVETLANLKAGDAVMIVASQPDPGSPALTAVTMLSGVEPILTAAPSANLSGWSIGGNDATSGGGGDAAQ